MAKPRNRSTLYRLIEAGQLVRRALLEPLTELGLQPGDDAILLVLAGGRPLTEAELATGAGVSPEQLRPHLERLIARGLAERRSLGPELLPGTALTGRGARLSTMLSAHWADLESLLTAGLDRSGRKALRRRLAQMVERLSS